jgi:hypothetical protein
MTESKTDWDPKTVRAVLDAYVDGIGKIQEMTKAKLAIIHNSIEKSPDKAISPEDAAVVLALRDIVSIIEAMYSTAQKAIDG